MSRFGHWRRSCPFTAGVLAVVAAVELVAAVGLSAGVVVLSGSGAAMAWLFAALLLVAGVTLLVNPALRHFAGVVALVVGVASLVHANLGGFLLGFAAAVVSGALALSWVPVDDPTSEPEQPSSAVLPVEH
ncbi:DUF6114 domain-containing protein [Saccharothrix texasensis]|uniref:DUF6114 domain-containing protein n=1 Tax=Saccharothrix texasensis TaxID=103734 RepID=UPI0011CDA2BA|nr:DUF6114 domain-containing protein [Saccharothrix texasensis]